MHIPEKISDQSSASEGAAVETASQSDPAETHERPYDLADLLSRITDDNLHPEQDTGEPQGNEQW